jgi:hypothetical protein
MAHNFRNPVSVRARIWLTPTGSKPMVASEGHNVIHADRCFRRAVRAVYNWMFGCRHRWSLPITVRSRTYVVCLDCGAEAGYNWQTMRIVRGKRNETSG